MCLGHLLGTQTPLFLWQLMRRAREEENCDAQARSPSRKPRLVPLTLPGGLPQEPWL